YLEGGHSSFAGKRGQSVVVPATVRAAGAGNAQISRASKIAGRQFLAFPCARRRARAVSALLLGMANAQVELNHQEYLRADRLALRRSNSHSPPLPAHTIAPTATRCSRSPANDDWVPAVRRAPVERGHDAVERRGLPTAPRLRASGDSAQTVAARASGSEGSSPRVQSARSERPRAAIVHRGAPFLQM